MENEKVFAMSFAKVYPMLIAKAERKGRTKDEVLEVTAWLTGYTPEQIEEKMQSDISYGDFFRRAPALNPNRKLIKGSICGVKVELIEDPLMQEIRYKGNHQHGNTVNHHFRYAVHAAVGDEQTGLLQYGNLWDSVSNHEVFRDML